MKYKVVYLQYRFMWFGVDASIGDFPIGLEPVEFGRRFRQDFASEVDFALNEAPYLHLLDPERMRWYRWICEDK